MEGMDRLLAAIETTAEGLEIVETQSGARLERPGRTEALVLYVISGRGVLRSRDGDDFELGANMLVVLPRGADVCVTVGRPAIDGDAGLELALAAVRATVSGAADLFVVLDTPITHDFGDGAVRQNFLMLAEEARSPTVGSRALADGVFKQALILLIRHRYKGPGAACPWIVATREPRLLPALSAMLDRPSDPISLDQLARMTGMSRSVFADRFAAAFGVTPIEFLKQIRLGRAARLLATTDFPVKKIARVVGYESRSYFSRAFRARYAVDPSDYRTRGRSREPSALSCS